MSPSSTTHASCTAAGPSRTPTGARSTWRSVTSTTGADLRRGAPAPLRRRTGRAGKSRTPLLVRRARSLFRVSSVERSRVITSPTNTISVLRDAASELPQRRLKGGWSYIYWNKTALFSEEFQDTIFSLLVEISTKAFGADMTPYW